MPRIVPKNLMEYVMEASEVCDSEKPDISFPENKEPRYLSNGLIVIEASKKDHHGTMFYKNWCNNRTCAKLGSQIAYAIIQSKLQA